VKQNSADSAVLPAFSVAKLKYSFANIPAVIQCSRQRTKNGWLVVKLLMTRLNMAL
jgi:hypothetical protein